LPFPEEWQVHLFLPDGQKYESGEEADFFRHNTPIPTQEAWKVLAAVYHGVLPAFLDRDLRLLRASLRDIHATGFKRRELEAQGARVNRLIELLAEHDDVAVGMSSMGPLVYGIASSEQAHILHDLGKRLESMGAAAYLGAATGRNDGHEIGGCAHD
jgi:beta-ribofuranosylaminobenzene 5'-phosphate synthase